MQNYKCDTVQILMDLIIYNTLVSNNYALKFQKYAFVIVDLQSCFFSEQETLDFYICECFKNKLNGKNNYSISSLYFKGQQYLRALTIHD